MHGGSQCEWMVRGEQGRRRNGALTYEGEKENDSPWLSIETQRSHVGPERPPEHRVDTGCVRVMMSVWITTVRTDMWTKVTVGLSMCYFISSGFMNDWDICANMCGTRTCKPRKTARYYCCFNGRRYGLNSANGVKFFSFCLCFSAFCGCISPYILAAL